MEQSSRAAGGRTNRRLRVVDPIADGPIADDRSADDRSALPGTPEPSRSRPAGDRWPSRDLEELRRSRDPEDLRLPGYARYTFPGRGDPTRPACAFAARTLRQWDMEGLRDPIVLSLTELIHDAMTLDPDWPAHDRAPQLLMLRHQHLLACAITRLRDDTGEPGALDLAIRSEATSPVGGWISRGTREQDVWLVFSAPR